MNYHRDIARHLDRVASHRRWASHPTATPRLRRAHINAALGLLRIAHALNAGADHV